MFKSKLERCSMENGTKMKHSKPIVKVFCYQGMLTILKIDFLKSGETKSIETSTEKFRMVNAMPLDTPKPKPFQIQPN